jgi:hypothetical protein
MKKIMLLFILQTQFTTTKSQTISLGSSGGVTNNGVVVGADFLYRNKKNLILSIAGTSQAKISFFNDPEHFSLFTVGIGKRELLSPLYSYAVIINAGIIDNYFFEKNYYRLQNNKKFTVVPQLILEFEPQTKKGKKSIASLFFSQKIYSLNGKLKYLPELGFKFNFNLRKK